MRLAIISDIHEDVEHLQIALKQIQNYSPDKIICLGDIVGFEDQYYTYKESRSAQACIRLLQSYGAMGVAGNHDLLAGKRIPAFASQIHFPENWYQLTLEEKNHTYKKSFFLYEGEMANDLDESGMNHLLNLASWKVIHGKEENVLFSHFVYPDVNGNIRYFPDRKKGFVPHFNWMSQLQCTLSFVGHAHIGGLGLVTKKGLKVKPFGLFTLKAEPQIVFCPPIARGTNKSGYLLYNTENRKLEVIRL